jgi:hypothetical protein
MHPDHEDPDVIKHSVRPLGTFRQGKLIPAGSESYDCKVVGYGWFELCSG